MGNDGSKKSSVKVGDLTTGVLVRVDHEVGVLRALQKDHGGWNSDMEQLIGKVGRVHHFTSKKDVVVEYKGSSKVWTLNARALTKVQKGENISSGDTVRICNNLQELKALQVGHGDWADPMKDVLGKMGKVAMVYPDGDLRVAVNGRTWTINRLACTLVAQGSGEEGASPDVEVDAGAALLAALLQQLVTEDGASLSGTNPAHLVQAAAKGNTANVRQILTKNPGGVDVMAQGKSALHVACHEGHIAIVRMLLDAGARLDLGDDDGDAALTFTAYGNQPQVMQLLLTKGADVNAQNDKGVNALAVAANKGHLACVQALLQHPRCKINLQDTVGDTALHEAVEKDHKEVVTLLLKQPGIDCSIENKKGFNVLHHAALAGNSFAAEKIVQKAPHIINARKEDGFSALHLAACNKHLEVAKVLVKAEAFMDNPNKDGLTPLFLAVIKGDMPIAELLLNHGANVQVTDNDGNTCLHLSAIGKHPDAAELLMSTLATVEALKSHGILGLLAAQGEGGAGQLVQNLAMEAAKEEQPEMMKLLLKKGASVNAQNKNGVSTLHIAINKENEAYVKILVEHHCDINVQDEDGDTPLHEAIKKDNKKILETLFTSRRKINYSLTNKNGFSVLHLAALQGNIFVTEKILDNAPHIVDLPKEDGFTALHLAAFNGNHEVATMLLKKGRASVNIWTKQHHTSLFMAVAKDDVRMVDLLLTHGADPTIVDQDGDTALHDAIDKGSQDVTERLVQHPATDFTITNKRGFNVLHHAALKGRSHATEKILATAPSIVDTKKDDGYTALHLASLNGHHDVAFVLITKGKASLDIYTHDMQTPLLMAVAKDHMRIVDLLISNGVDINIVDKDGDTSLHLALMRHAALNNPLMQLLTRMRGQGDGAGDALGIACYLCQRGADLHKKNHKGQSSLDLVQDPSLKATLLRYGGTRGTKFTPPSATVGKTPTAPSQDSAARSGAGESTSEEMKRMQKRMEDMEETVNCVICRENPRTVAFMCGHTACVPCSHALTVCHMCRQPVTKKINLFN